MLNKTKPFFIIILLAVTLNSYVNQMSAGASTQSPLQPLQDVSAFLSEEGISMTQWEIVLKEQFQENQLPALLNQLKSTNPDLSVTTHETEDATKIIATNHHKSMPGSEQFIILVSKHEEPYAEIIYKMTGPTWDSHTKQFMTNRLNRVKSAFFQENTTIFTCVKADKNDKIDGVLLLEKFSTRLEIEKLQTLTEPGFISVTGFTNEWNQALPYSDNGAMNVQYALRQGMGAKTTLIFGTPIITSEY